MLANYKSIGMIMASALIATAVDRAVSAALAQGDTVCGIAQSRPCELTGYKVLSNQKAPGLRLLQIETEQGPRIFVATRAIMERFAKELLETLQSEKL
jgi:hypothetical protein